MRLQRISSADISKFPDQASYKLERLMTEVERLADIVDNLQ